jgi:hypothetical protein
MPTRGISNSNMQQSAVKATLTACAIASFCHPRIIDFSGLRTNRGTELRLEMRENIFRIAHR